MDNSVEKKVDEELKFSELFRYSGRMLLSSESIHELLRSSTESELEYYLTFLEKIKTVTMLCNAILFEFESFRREQREHA